MSGVTGAVATREATPIEVVARLAEGLSDHRELNQFLADIARSARGMLNIDRVTIFTLEGDELVPAVAASQLPDDELWASFREMPPVALDVTGLAAEVLTTSQPTVVDAQTSPLVPPAWRERFGLSSLAIAPLRADGEVRGVLIADSADPSRARFSRDQLGAIGAVASLAGMALSRFERAREANTQVATAYAAVRALSSGRDAASIARVCAAAMRAVTGAETCAVHVVGDEPLLEVDPPAAAAAVEDQRDVVAKRCAAERDTFVQHGPDTLMGMWRGDELMAVAQLAGLPRDFVHSSVPQAAAAVLAQHTAALLSAARRSSLITELEDRHLALVQVLTHVRLTEPSSLVECIAQRFRECAGAELLDVVVAGRVRAQALRLRAASGADAEQIGRWRRRAAKAEATTVGGRVLVPLIADDEVVGALALRTSQSTDMDVVRAVAGAIAHRVAVGALRADLRDQVALAEAATARERLERSARLSASRMLDAAMSTIAGSAASVRNGTVHPAVASHVSGILADAKGELSALEDVLLQLDTGRAGLGPKLRALAKSMNRPGTTVEVRTERGAGRPEPPHAMQVVLAVREIVMLAYATRAARVIIRLADRGGTSIVEVKADGRLSLATGTDGPSAYNIVRSVQRELETTGTRVDMSNDGSWFTVRFISREANSPVRGNAKGSSSVCQV